MMDANLEWELTSTTALSGSLAGVTQAFFEQFGTPETLSEPLAKAADTAIGRDAAPAVHRLDGVVAAADRVQSAFAGLREQLLAEFDAPPGDNQVFRFASKDLAPANLPGHAAEILPLASELVFPTAVEPSPVSAESLTAGEALLDDGVGVLGLNGGVEALIEPPSAAEASYRFDGSSALALADPDAMPDSIIASTPPLTLESLGLSALDPTQIVGDPWAELAATRAEHADHRLVDPSAVFAGLAQKETARFTAGDEDSALAAQGWAEWVERVAAETVNSSEAVLTGLLPAALMMDQRHANSIADPDQDWRLSSGPAQEWLTDPILERGRSSLTGPEKDASPGLFTAPETVAADFRTLDSPATLEVRGDEAAHLVDFGTVLPAARLDESMLQTIAAPGESLVLPGAGLIAAPAEEGRRSSGPAQDWLTDPILERGRSSLTGPEQDSSPGLFAAPEIISIDFRTFGSLATLEVRGDEAAHSVDFGTVLPAARLDEAMLQSIAAPGESLVLPGAGLIATPVEEGRRSSGPAQEWLTDPILERGRLSLTGPDQDSSPGLFAAPEITAASAVSPNASKAAAAPMVLGAPSALDWDLSAASDVAGALSGLVQSFAEQFSIIEGMLADFETAALGLSTLLEALETTTAVGGLNPISEAVSRLEAAFESLRDNVFDEITDLIDGAFANDLADAINTRLETANGAGFTGGLTSGEISAVFTLDNFIDGTLVSDIEDLLSAESLGTVSLDDAFSFVSDALSDQLGGDAFSVEFEDITVGGETLIDFEAAAGGGLSISINLPEVVTDFADIINGRIPGLGLFDSLVSNSGGAAPFSFVLTTLVEAGGSTGIERIGFNLSDFDLAPLVELGGASPLGEEISLRLGLLDFTASEIEFLTYRLGLSLGDDANLGAAVTLGGTPDVDVFAEGFEFEVSQFVAEPGSNSFTAIEADTFYGFVSLNLEGSLNFGGEEQALSAFITLGSVLNDSAAANKVSAFINALEAGVRVDTSGLDLPDAVATALEQSVQALSAIEGDEILGFLESVQGLIIEFLRDSALNLDIPFTGLNIADLTNQIGDVFADIMDKLSYSGAVLGFEPGVFPDDLTRGADAQTGGEITADLLNALADYSALNLSVFDESGTEQQLTVNLSGTLVVDSTASLASRVQALVDLLDAALDPHGFEITASSGALVAALSTGAFGSTSRGTFGVRSAVKLDGSVDETVSLIELGFDAGQLANQLTTYNAGTNEDTVLRLEEANTSTSLGQVDIAALAGVTEVNYRMVIGGVETELRVQSEGGWNSADELAASINDALVKQGIGMTAGIGGDGTLSFALDAGEDRAISIIPFFDQLLAVPTFDQLLDFVASQLGAVLPGAVLELSERGELIFQLPDIAAALEIGAGDGVRLDLEGLGVGDLANLSLGADISAKIEGELSAGLGLDLTKIASVLTESAPTALAGAKALGDELSSTILQALFLDDVRLEAGVEAEASGITGTADLGLLTVEIGGEDASQNIMALAGDFSIGLVGQDPEEGYSSRVTFDNLLALASDTVAVSGPALVSLPSQGLASILGQLDLAGAIVVDGEGRALDANGDVIASGDYLQIVDPGAYSGDNPLAQMFIQLGDVSVSVAGIDGINEGIIDGISLSIGNLTQPLETLEWALIGADPAALDSITALTNLDSGDILDSLTAIANLLEIAADSLSDQLPFLEAEIPILNFSILDQLDFATDFLAKLQEVRNNPQGALDEIKDVLESAFGQDTVTLIWDGELQTLNLGLSFKLLEDVDERLPFQLDLVQLLADQIGDFLPEELLDFVSGFVDVSGSGDLVFDPNLSLDFNFGIDLSPVLATPTTLATGATLLDQLSTVSGILSASDGGDDVVITVRDLNTNKVQTVGFKIDPSLTLEQQITAINAELGSQVGDAFKLSFDAVTGQVTLENTEGVVFDNLGVETFFGAERIASTEVDGAHQIELGASVDPAAGGRFVIALGGEDIILEVEAEAGRDLAGLTAALNTALVQTTVSRAVLGGNVLTFGAVESGTADPSIPGVIALEPDAIDDFGAAQSFEIPVVGGTVTVEVEAEAGRTEQGLIDAINEAILNTLGEQGLLQGGATPGVTINLGQLLSFSQDGGQIVLRASNYAEAAGYDATQFEVLGIDISPELRLSVEERNGSNGARLLGFGSSASVDGAAIVGEALFEAVDRGAPRIFIDTETSGIVFTFEAGAAEGLNLGLGLGPINFEVVDGKVLLNAGDGSGDPALLSFGINDIDGDEHAGQFDISFLKEIATNDDVSVTDLLDLDVQIGVDVDLPFSDTLGIFDPKEHGLTWQTQILALKEGASWADTDFDNLTATFDGELPNLFDGKGVDLEKFDLKLPDLGDFISNINVLELINDPRLVLGGINDIFGEVNDFFTDFMDDLNLPIVGDSLSVGLSFFDDVINSVIQPAFEWANTPLPDGSLPTTVDLLTGFLNDQLNTVFGTDDVVYIQAFLDTSGSASQSYIYGALNFSGTLFSEMLDIDFDFGIPGFNIEVEEGSEILMELDYTVNIGFGFDRNGFFLLNDTDRPEIEIEFLVDAGTFSGSMSVLNLLGLSAQAVTLDENGAIVGEARTDGGTAQLTAFLTADLYGDSGLTISDPSASSTQSLASNGQLFRDFSNITPLDGDGELLTYERVVYLNQLNFSELVEFDFGAEIDVNIGFVGNVLNPFTGDAIEIGGFQILPDVMAELVMDAGYTLQDGLVVDALGINNVRIDASQLYDALIRPLVDPILAFVQPLLEVIDVIFQPPLGYLKDIAVDLIAAWFPIIRLADNIAEVANSVAQFVVDLADAGGMVQFGDFDFTDFAPGMISGETTVSGIDIKTVDRGGFLTASSKPDLGTFGDITRGFSVDIPLIKDPFSAISMLLGDFSGVDLVRARYTLFNIDTANLDFTEPLLDAIDIPGWAKDAIREAADTKVGFQNSIEGYGVTKFEIGYDLSGIQNFINSFDPFRLFDGVFIEASPGSLVDVDIDFTMLASVVAAGIEGTGSVDFEFNINDPNDDGKLRLSELLDVIVAMVKAGAILPQAQVAYLTEGKIQFGVSAEAWFGPFDKTLFEFSIPEFELELYKPEPNAVGALDSAASNVLSLEGILNLFGLGPDENLTQVLNIGSRVISSNSDIEQDGDDLIVLGAPIAGASSAAASAQQALLKALGFTTQATGGGLSATMMAAGGDPFAVSTANAEGTLSGDINPDASAIVIPAGEGDNVIDMSGFADAASERVTITYTGAGTDTVTLPMGGLNVVFLGDGDDIVTAPPGAQGTYVIFAEGGADTIDIPGGNVIVFSGKDYGMRDVFLTEFAEGNIAAERVRELLGINANGTVNPDSEAFYDIGLEARVNLAGLIEKYTEVSQTKADRDVETVTVGAGNHVILTGKGDDVIRGTLSHPGEVTVLSGAGDDDIRIGAAKLFIEGGAGSDIIQVNGEDVEVWGWGKAAGVSGAVGNSSEIDALARKDGGDVLIGGSGDDRLYGQIGADILEGNLGADTVSGGLGDDLMTGGKFDIALNGDAINIRDLNLDTPAPGTLTIEIDDIADGDDVMAGGRGDDIMLGGGGRDTLNGEAGRDLLVGDFASIVTSGSLVVREFISQFASSDNQGSDTLDGGAMDDILVGGGNDGDMETLTDLLGDNVLIGDFGFIDGGDIREAQTTINSINNAKGGADTLTTGRGDDVLIGGEGGDVLNAGLGVDILFGDNGLMDWPGLTFTGLALDTDGDDQLDMGEDSPGAGDPPAPIDQNDLAFGGLGDDIVTAGVGGLTLIGDSGVMTLRESALQALLDYDHPGNAPTDEALADAEADWFQFDIMVEEGRTTADVRDGNDQVTVAGGINMIALGGGDDAATLRDGLNFVLGDDGVMETTPNAAGDAIIYDLTSTDMAAASGDDRFTAGDGDNVVIGGDQGDRFDMGDGYNLILGDRGVFKSSSADAQGILTSDASLIGGDDVINTGAGNAIIIAGQGDDMISVGDGDDIATGDDAEIVHTHAWEILSLTTLHHAQGGDDSFTAQGTRGDTIMMGQTGDDSVIGGLDDDMAVGDNADMSFLPFEQRFGGQSGLDRFIRFESVRPDVDGDDVLRGEAGVDYLVGGFGDEEMFGGDGQDILIGDTAIIERLYSAQGGGAFGELWIDTNFAYEIGGYDQIHGEAGFDIMIGNLGPDLFFGNTAEDVIFSDAVAGYFTSEFDAQLFNQATPQWWLIQVNFAGPTAIDVVSKAQTADSIGLSLDRPVLPLGDEYRFDSQSVRPDVLFDRAPDLVLNAGQVDQLMDYVLSDALMSAIAELMAMGLDGDALRDAIAAAINAHMGQTLQIDFATQAQLLERLMTIIEDRLQLSANATFLNTNADAAPRVAAE
jgi:Ca2+-binding RTX toxin-like protein